jgi:predicted transcriptional regulator
MRIRLRSLEQLLPLPTAGELVAHTCRALVSVSQTTSAREALRAMEEHDIGFVPVVDGEALVGVVSERDIARGVILHQRAVVRDVMVTRIHTVPADAELSDCMTVMHATRVRHLPVMNGNAVLGVLSVRDVMGALLERDERLLRQLQDERVMLLSPYSSSY